MQGLLSLGKHQSLITEQTLTEHILDARCCAMCFARSASVSTYHRLVTTYVVATYLSSISQVRIWVKEIYLLAQAAKEVLENILALGFGVLFCLLVSLSKRKIGRIFGVQGVRVRWGRGQHA